jgi:2-phospho-L-lactate guanylyltransferase
MVPVKGLARAKSRLRGAADGGIGAPQAHERLVIALSRDTARAASAAPQVRRVIVLTSDPRVTRALTADGVTVFADRPELDLNGALRFGAGALGDAGIAIGALQADLPALRTAELADALDSALGLFRAGLATRAFCPDAHGDGTTLLLAAPGIPLSPRFGPGSATAHEHDGAARLLGDWPGLRQDVDHPDDLRRAEEIGLGPATAETLARLRNTTRSRC